MQNLYLKILGGVLIAGILSIVGYSLLNNTPAAWPGDNYDNSPQSTESTNQNTNTNQSTAPTTNMTHKQTAILETTVGTIEIELSAETPVTSSNFVTLANQNFYDGTIFHRVIKGFMIQGGDPNTTKPESNNNIYGTGGPGYRFNDEKFTGEYTRGTVAMANSGPNTNGSQFFIMHADYPLPKNYIIFGHVVKGLDVVDKIANAPVKMSGSGENSKPATPVAVKSITVR